MKTTLIAAVAALCLASPVRATVWNFNNFAIDGIQEGNASPGTGVGSATLDDVTGAMSVSGSFSGLTGLTNNAHVHCCSTPPTPAGILFGITFTNGATSGTFSGNATLTPANVANVLNGLSYVNIHTTTFGGGEIRGQIVNPVPEPATFGILAIGACGLLAIGRRSR
jgi:hypothetical protein